MYSTAGRLVSDLKSERERVREEMFVHSLKFSKDGEFIQTVS